jgi:PPOX class probable F420-dependent enzyme
VAEARRLGEDDPVADLELVRRLVAADQGLAIVGTTRSDGTIQASLVNAGVLRHPDGQHDVVGFVARGGAHKLRNLRARPRASVAFRAGWEWAAVEGPATIIGPDDGAGGTDPERLRTLLRDVFSAAGGTHDDWDEYDRVMSNERRAAVLVTPERISGNF